MFVAWTTGDAKIVGSDAEAANALNHTFHASTVHSYAVLFRHLPANSSGNVVAFPWLASERLVLIVWRRMRLALMCCMAAAVHEAPGV